MAMFQNKRRKRTIGTLIIILFGVAGVALFAVLGLSAIVGTATVVPAAQGSAKLVQTLPALVHKEHVSGYSQTAASNALDIWTRLTSVAEPHAAHGAVDEAVEVERDHSGVANQPAPQDGSSEAIDDSMSQHRDDETSEGGTPATAGSFPPGSCAPQLTEALAGSVARPRGNGSLGLLMFAVASKDQVHFFENWTKGVRAAGIDYALAAVVDEEAEAVAAAAKLPCFRWDLQGVLLGDMGWGGAGWIHMTWQKPIIVRMLVDWGFDVVLSDIDVAWLRDPEPLLDANPAADILFSHDGVWTHNERPKEQTLELEGSPQSNLNTGGRQMHLRLKYVACGVSADPIVISLITLLACCFPDRPIHRSGNKGHASVHAHICRNDTCRLHARTGKGTLSHQARCDRHTSP